MERSFVRFLSITMILPGCVLALALLAGCSGTKETTAQTEAKPAPPPKPAEAPPVAAPPPAPVAKQEMEAPAAAPPVDPMAWAASLTDVYFDYDRSIINKSEYGTLNTVGQLLKEDGKRKVLVEGHCDARGTTSYNLTLGEKRARAVKSYLGNLGIRDAQVQITSYGKERPVCSDTDENCYHRNRRAHFSPQ